MAEHILPGVPDRYPEIAAGAPFDQAHIFGKERLESVRIYAYVSRYNVFTGSAPELEFYIFSETVIEPHRKRAHPRHRAVRTLGYESVAHPHRGGEMLDERVKEIRANH